MFKIMRTFRVKMYYICRVQWLVASIFKFYFSLNYLGINVISDILICQQHDIACRPTDPNVQMRHLSCATIDSTPSCLFK